MERSFFPHVCKKVRHVGDSIGFASCYNGWTNYYIYSVKQIALKLFENRSWNWFYTELQQNLYIESSIWQNVFCPQSVQPSAIFQCCKRSFIGEYDLKWSKMWISFSLIKRFPTTELSQAMVHWNYYGIKTLLCVV